jgi:AcrR family transcriptional regulator
MPRVVDHELKRTDVAEATWRVIEKHGLHAATIRAIAEEAGCSTGAIVHYFKNKDDVFIFSLRLATDRLAQRIERCRQGVSGHETLRRVFAEYLPLDGERALEWHIWVAFLTRSVNNPRLTQEQRTWYKGFRNLLRDIILEGQQSGAFRSDIDPGEEADTLVALVDGIGVHAIREPQRFPPEYQTALMNRHLLLRLSASGTDWGIRHHSQACNHKRKESH